MNWLFWASLSAVFAGITAIFAKIGVTNVDSNFATAVRTSVVLVFAWLIAFFWSTQSIAQISFRSWSFLVLSGFATGASWLCYFKALQVGEVSKVVAVDKLSLIVAMLLAALILGESFTWRQGLGAVLILLGSLLFIKT